MKKSEFEGVHVVAKFFLSKAPSGEFTCISRTLGKFSIVDKNFTGKVENKDLWVCKVVREIKPGENKGAFVLMPVEKIIDPQTTIRKLIPGFYEVHPAGNGAFLIPNSEPSSYWVLSHGTRQIFSSRYYAVVVPIDYKEPALEDAFEENLAAG